MGCGVSDEEIPNHQALSEHDPLMLPAIGEDGSVFEEGEHREAVQRNVSDDCLNDKSHNIARRVSVVSSAEDGESGSGYAHMYACMYSVCKKRGGVYGYLRTYMNHTCLLSYFVLRCSHAYEYMCDWCLSWLVCLCARVYL